MKVKENNRHRHDWGNEPRSGIFTSIAQALELDKKSRIDHKAQSMIEYLGFINILKNGEIIRKDESIERLLRVRSTDLVFLDKNTRDKYMDSFTNFNRIYTDDYKIIIITSRLDTTAQQLYWRQLRSSIRNLKTRQERQRLKLVNESLRQIDLLTRDPDYFDTNFYLMIFGKNHQVMELRTQSAAIADDGLLGLEPLNQEETKTVLTQMNNLNSK